MRSQDGRFEGVRTMHLEPVFESRVMGSCRERDLARRPNLSIRRKGSLRVDRREKTLAQPRVS
jgi:hypothetical protein